MNFEILASVLFPRSCLVCRKYLRADVLCEGCRRTVAISGTPFCGQCGAVLPRAGYSPRLSASPCHPAFPYTLGAAGSYEDNVLKTLIHALKFRGVRAAAAPLADLMAEYVSLLKMDLREYLVTPIPLSRKRFRARGFNQSEYIAKRFAERLCLLLETGCLIRTKHAKPQSETENLRERKGNIRGCFATTDAEAIRGKNIVLIDDVCTSGATFLEAAQTLRSAGVAKIFALAAAKA